MSACIREVSVHIEELLDFFESARSGSLKKLELLDVTDRMLETSLGSREVVCRLVALRNRLATPDEADTRESLEVGRNESSWKFDT